MVDPNNSNNHDGGDDMNKKVYTIETKCVDGNTAIASVAYRTNECAYIFPITPSSPMGEEVDAWAAQHKKTLLGQELKVVEMQSEGGAAGALHGALVSGALATTFTASQGLLLFIPNMYKIAGELLPTVIHVASRALAGEGLSIYGDHSDTMMVRGCGWAIVGSFSVQEAHDMAMISQVATLKSRVPFVHFMDGFRTSHEINKIKILSDDQLRDLMPWDQVEEHRGRALSPMHPDQRGTAQTPDVFMQLVESSNTHYMQVDKILGETFKEFEKVTGRLYKPYEYYYYGTSEPTIAIVTMGSSVQVIDHTLKNLKLENVCLIGARMFRPWIAKTFCDAIPKSVNRVAVLDRTREGGSQGEPLYLDVCTSLMIQGRTNIFVAGGRYGLGSKDLAPIHVKAIISNMQHRDTADIQRPYTVGITDDVTNLSLSLGRPLNTFGEEVTQCVFWGFGGDGTVGANKEGVKMIAEYHSQMQVQCYVEYDAKKSSGWTISHLRFSPETKIEAPFRIEENNANYVACHNESYVQAHKFDVAKHMKRRGTFFLNTTVASIPDETERLQALEALISPKILRKLALKNVKLYIMDAASLAKRFGLAGRINMICMAAFFRLSGVIPQDDAIGMLKAAIRKNYGKKGDEVVQKNISLLDCVVSDPNSLISVEVPQRWRTIPISEQAFRNRHIELVPDQKLKKFMLDIGDPVTRLEGDDIPVSKFLENNLLGGVMVPGTTKFEKRNPNPTGRVPVWDTDKCTQCNICAYVCPHAAIRPFVVTKDEAEKAPFASQFKTVKASGVELAGKRYTLQVSVLDCTGCNACVEACPETPKALDMRNIQEEMKAGEENFAYALGLPTRDDLVDKYTLKGSQFQTPLMEFSGACSGCGETPYFKLLTQLFGQRMVIANATGCSTIWGGSFPSNPYTVHPETGRGPCWANSLFEDNAEYGLGMFSAMKNRRERLVGYVKDYLDDYELNKEARPSEEKELASILMDWMEIRDEKTDRPTLLFDKMKPLFKALLPEKESVQLPDRSKLSLVWAERDMFPKLTQWIVGGDGWAYDIGFGGLDHVVAFCNDLNVLVVDTEMYSNTGGQQSKATPLGAAVKFAMGGKQQRKKNIGEMFMTYEHVYVASVSLHNHSQVLQAFLEADRHNGPSIIIAYAPCEQQGVRPQGLNDMIDECRFACESGYWPLYRYKPALAAEGHNPFILDCKKLRKDISAFLQRETRFLGLQKKDPKLAKELWEHMNHDVLHRMEHLQQLAAGYKNFEGEEAPVLTLFASETGTAARVAQDFADACTLSSSATALDDIEIDDLDGMTSVFFISTCGQGAMPQNGRRFLDELKKRTEPFKEGTRFMVFGLGDSSYFFFLKAAKDVEERMESLGASKMLTLGAGDDSAEEGMEEGLHDWLDHVWPALEVPPPKEVPHIVPMKATFSERAVLRAEDDAAALEKYFRNTNKAVSTSILSNDLMCRPDYNRDFRTIRMTGGGQLSHELGDALEIFPQNDPEKVADFLHEYSKDFGDHTVVNLHAFGVDGEISLGALFTYVLDLFGKPTKHFLQQLATFETDPEERKAMLEPDLLKKAAKETGMTYADALLRYKKAHPPLPALLAMIPRIKPRAYSIASAPLASKDVIELLVLIETWWCNEGMRYGLNCNMLRKVKAGDRIWCRIHAGSMEPPSPEQAVVCAGIGSGLAPHMAFLRDHVRAAEAGEKVGPFSLFFGNRYKADEYLYQSELEEYEKKYHWFKLHAAFSRDDPKKKIYVQDLVAMTDDAKHLLRETPDGLLYVCGNRNLPKPLQDALVESFSSHSKDPAEIASASQAMENLFLQNRAQQEVW